MLHCDGGIICSNPAEDDCIVHYINDYFQDLLTLSISFSFETTHRSSKQ